MKILLILSLLISLHCFAAPKAKAKAKVKPKHPAKRVEKVAEKPPEKAVEKPVEMKISHPAQPPPTYAYLDTRLYRYKLNTMLGLNVVQGSALLAGMQLGYAISKTSPFYIGPEFNFSLFSPGSIFAVVAGAWYEMRVQGSNKMVLSIGAVAGPGFNSAISSAPATPLVIFLDAALAQEMDDLSSVRAQFRPGIIGRYFAFMMNFNISFRFL